MALSSKVKILGSKEAKTQYVTLPASMTDDSQYAFKAGDDAYITAVPDNKLLIITSEQVTVDMKEGVVSIYLKKAPPKIVTRQK